jgi:hypothetical protein
MGGESQVGSKRWEGTRSSRYNHFAHPAKKNQRKPVREQLFARSEPDAQPTVYKASGNK